MSWWSEEEIEWSGEETGNPLRADDRNFYKVEKWTKDGTNRAHALRRQQSRQGSRAVRRSSQASAKDQVDHPAADASTREMAQGMTLRGLSFRL